MNTTTTYILGFSALLFGVIFLLPLESTAQGFPDSFGISGETENIYRESIPDEDEEEEGEEGDFDEEGETTP